MAVYGHFGFGFLVLSVIISDIMPCILSLSLSLLCCLVIIIILIAFFIYIY